MMEELDCSSWLGAPPWVAPALARGRQPLVGYQGSKSVERRPRQRPFRPPVGAPLSDGVDERLGERRVHHRVIEHTKVAVVAAAPNVSDDRSSQPVVKTDAFFRRRVRQGNNVGFGIPRGVVDLSQGNVRH